MVPLMEYILADAEVVGEYFKNIIDLYDGDVTSQELYRDDNFVIFNTCLEQVFECLKTILCWNGFGEQVELLKLALSHFANRSTKLDKDKYRSINISPPFFILRYQHRLFFLKITVKKFRFATIWACSLFYIFTSGDAIQNTVA